MTAQDRALDALRADIRDGLLGPGDQVVQETLADRYGLSRVPIREALKTLEAEGLVVYHANRGYFVAALQVSDLVEVYRLRELLETEAITVGVPTLTEVDLAQLADLLGEVEAASATGDLVRLTAANRRFHFAIFDAADQPRLSRLLRQLWDATDAYRAVYFAAPENRSRVDREHAAMLGALRRRNVSRVVQLQDQHRRRSVAAVRAALERENA